MKNLKDIVKPTPNYNGYDPLYGKISIKKNNGNQVESEKNNRAVDMLKFSYLERLVKETKEDGVQMAFFISPSFEKHEDLSDFEPVLELSRKHGVPIIDNSGCAEFVGVEDYFQDYTHLNHQGAVAYSQSVVPQIEVFLKHR